MSQYTISYKYGKGMRQLKIKRELKKFPSTNNGGRRKSLRTGVEWKVIELLENTTPGSAKKATKYGIKIFQDKKLENFILTI